MIVIAIWDWEKHGTKSKKLLANVSAHGHFQVPEYRELYFYGALDADEGLSSSTGAIHMKIYEKILF